MGKFKELYIKYSNLDEETKKIINSYPQEFISDRNNIRVSLLEYILKSNKYIYELKAINGTAHLWTWSDFRRESKGRVLSYKTESNIVLSQLLEFYTDIDIDLLNKYGLEIIKRIN
ncbi:MULTISPECIES: hypothetical protein [Clostridium]|uniref:hypothetical protein n=1 Tax=Clostridium TaxID=1485 RepID=UPI0018995FC8|nr:MULTISPECIES: hypothetical protein [Clostridium]MCR1953192.1 hypothetical protein [Clostridium sp. DSM 100503]MDI9215497.1 hypothetical protein [Clostridium tertium]